MKPDVRGGALACAMAASALATNFPEVEPNNTKAQATYVAGMTGGDTLSGLTTSGLGSGLDYFKIHMAPAPSGPGIYRHRLALTSPISGQVGTIRGLNQNDGVIDGADFTAQSSSPGTLPPFFNQWYGFGGSADLFYRVAGSAETTQPYTATLDTQPVTPVFLGQFHVGMITITTVNQGHVTDTDLWVYDGQFNAIPGYGNDNAPFIPGQTGIVTQSSLTRSFSAGTYYLALSDANLANNLPSPEDDLNRNGVVLDFPGSVLTSSAAQNVNVSFAIGPAGGQLTPFAATKEGPYDVRWFRFEVVPAPGTAGMLGLVGLTAVRRRR
jgi:hypothetical protein